MRRLWENDYYGCEIGGWRVLVAQNLNKNYSGKLSDSSDGLITMLRLKMKRDYIYGQAKAISWYANHDYL